MIETFLFKLTFIPGLKEVVVDELHLYADIFVLEIKQDAIYVSLDSNFETITKLKSILNVYVVMRGPKLNPYYIFKHKSMLGELIETVCSKNTAPFKTFTVSCAGEESKEVRKIREYVAETYKLAYNDSADLEIFIGKSKTGDMWEVGVRGTARPLSLRSYKVANIKGGLNTTIAYAMNSLIGLESAHTYLNIFSGSGTLLIEAGGMNKKLVLKGFDSDGKTIAQAVKNIKKAGFVKRVSLIRADIFENPDMGKFDSIAADLPFGMQISKYEDLGALYEQFVEYCERILNHEGRLVTITSEHDLLKQKLSKSKFKITQTLELKVPTSVGAYLHPRIFVCEFE